MAYSKVAMQGNSTSEWGKRKRKKKKKKTKN